jgi:hypothetical protein
MESTNLAEFPEEVNRLLAERAVLRENERRVVGSIQQFTAFAQALDPVPRHPGMTPPTLGGELPRDILMHTVAIGREADAVSQLSTEIQERHARIRTLRQQVDESRKLRMLVFGFGALVIAFIVYWLFAR